MSAAAVVELQKMMMRITAPSSLHSSSSSSSSSTTSSSSPQRFLRICLISAIVLVVPVASFSPFALPLTSRSLRSSSSTSAVVLNGTRRPKNENGGEIRDLESARRYFERLIGPMLLEDTATPPVLTSMDRKRRQVEVRLLRSLVDSDGAIDELMALWMQAECDGLHNAQTTAALKWMETECGDRIATEETLRDMIAECSSWPEPAARLALLLYSQGRYAESYEYTQMVLQKKPWHFEALQLQVLLFLVSSDRAGAIWAARAGLPGLNQRRKRQAWVSKAVAQATDQLYLLEQQQRQRELVNVQPSSAFYHDGFFESSSGDLQPWQ